MTTGSADFQNGDNNDKSASPPPTTSVRAANPGHQSSTTQQAGFRAIPGEASPRRAGLTNCSVCDTKFTIFEHRHMCQKCQESVCNRCSRGRKVFRVGTKSKRVCDDCVKTFPSATKIISNMSNTIESGNHSRLTLPASDVADTCAERTMATPSPVTAFFGIGMVGMPSPRTVPPPTPAGEDDSALTPLATAFGRFQVGAKAFFGDRRASGDNVDNVKPDVQITSTIEVKTPPSSSTPPPTQQQYWAQGGMGLVTNGDRGQASENGHNNDMPASSSTISERTVKPGCQPSTTQAGFRAIPGEVSPRRTDLSKCSVCDTKFTIFEHRHTCQKCQESVCNRCSCSRKVFRAGTKSRRVCDDCVKTFPSATKIVSDMSNAIESGNPSRLTLPASDAANTCADRTMLAPSLAHDQEVACNEVALQATDGSQAEENNKTDIVNGTELKAATTDVSIITTVDILAGAAPSTDMPALAAPELSPEEVQVHEKAAEVDSEACDTSGTVRINVVDGTLLPAEPEVALSAPEEHPPEKDAETAIANSASISSRKNSPRLKWMHFAIKICGCMGTVQTNPVDGALLPAPEERHTENDAETAIANSASTSSTKSGARRKWMHVAPKICGRGLAAVFMGLEIGLHLLERDWWFSESYRAM